jgi:hypothetical protein
MEIKQNDYVINVGNQSDGYNILKIIIVGSQW